MQSAPHSTDGRRSDRMRTYMAARISFNNGQVTVDCTIRNISDGGAKLQVSGAVTLPDEFELVIPQRHQKRRVRLCWRTDDFCGVAYLDGHDEHAGASDADTVEAGLRQHIRELEGKIAQLQRRIDELSGG
ncbi:MAG TPA: PilZ domain-containing protein [Saliniramus sp.]|nr:PilZ domain-containing protein [Saliniramus sp.]